jgi:16S rRNA (cytosine1402-N4)-methyltransferase
MTAVHEPVLLEEAMHYLAPDDRDGVFVDCTVGSGGHAAEILRRASASAKLLGLDVDQAAIKAARKPLKKEEKAGRATFLQRNFKELPEALDELKIERVSGILADLGVSSLQLEDQKRGFSFMRDGPLDMRMNQALGATAADLVNKLHEQALSNLIFEFSEEPFARRIARALIEARAKKPIKRTSELRQIVERAKPPRGGGIHPATKTFQALRIAVNRELDGLDTWIDKAAERLSLGARMVILSFHSLEDRVVKHAFQYLERTCICPPRQTQCECGKVRAAKILTKRPVGPQEAEIARNPRARSAKLRACERV